MREYDRLGEYYMMVTFFIGAMIGAGIFNKPDTDLSVLGMFLPVLLAAHWFLPGRPFGSPGQQGFFGDGVRRAGDAGRFPGRLRRYGYL